jgi:uncharacterized membrane protein HdeD (DUF308 family)
LYFIGGAASVVLGVLAFRHSGSGYAILLLAIWIAVGFIFRGVTTTRPLRRSAIAFAGAQFCGERGQFTRAAYSSL